MPPLSSSSGPKASGVADQTTDAETTTATSTMTTPTLSFSGQYTPPTDHILHRFHHDCFPQIDVDTTIDEASLIMNKTHQKMSFVVDNSRQIQGIISTARLGDHHVVTTARQRNCNRSELSISDVMINIDELDSISTETLSKMNAADVLQYMQHHGTEFLLVRYNKSNKIYGYFDRLEVTSALGLVSYAAHPAKSFRELVEQVFGREN